VGYTALHHTFFEMLGNFSFGDYFKREEIGFAWQFLTEELGLPPERLWVTVHVSDDEAADIWLKEVGVDSRRFSRLDEDNFWQMGDTGPCGPCSEIFYDHGPEVAGGPPGSEGDDLDRYIEIWNLVFMQYDRQVDGSLTPLPRPSVDTGMGLERIAAVMQSVHSNYEIDLFRGLIEAAARQTGCTDLSQRSLNVLADHIRSASFLITDGVIPSNEGRGYVLRRIIRRALRHGHKLGQEKPFFHKLMGPLVREMGDAFPELAEAAGRVEKTLLAEEEQFGRTLAQGMKVFEQAIDGLTGDSIPGDILFTLYDTHGFPPDLTNDVARERGLSVDMVGFEACMAAQRERARGAEAFTNDYADRLHIDSQTAFCGYQDLEGKGDVVALLSAGEETGSLQAGESGVVVLTETPFYGESGGQVGDQGYLEGATGRFRVLDTRKRDAAWLHIGEMVQGTLRKGETLCARVNEDRRRSIMRNHSATHLLHAALRVVLGEHVTQKGSLVGPDYLRFDFSHGEALTDAQLMEIERVVNRHILANTPVTTELMSIDAAKQAGAMALFGEKYDDQVRVLTMGEAAFSRELCGGTHVARTGDIGLFRIIGESASAAGIRRIEAVTAEQALARMQTEGESLRQIGSLVRSSSEQLVARVEQLVARSKEQEKEIDRLRQKIASGSGSDLAAKVRQIGDVGVLVSSIEGADSKALRTTVDRLKDKLGSAVILLASPSGDRVSLVAGVTSDLVERFSAGELVSHVATQLGGKGGGRADMAQGGAANSGALQDAMDSVDAWILARQ